jgi:branched-chain amino acid transport system permease protein
MKKNLIFTIISFVVLIGFLFYAQENMDNFTLRILNLCAIYAILGLSLNLINGFTGQFSLGHAGFMAIGAYTTALLTIPTEMKQMIFVITPIAKCLENLNAPFPIALVIAGLFTALIGGLISAPVLKLKGDYLAIATLGFSEIIRILFTNMTSITNGAAGLKGIPGKTNLWWTFGVVILTTVLIKSLINSSYGRALKAIREDEIAAESMGINLFKHKIIAFVIGAFFAGVGGGLLGNLITSIDPNYFKFTITFNILLIVVLGGIGSITGSIIGAFVVTIVDQMLVVLDMPMSLGAIEYPGIPGMRMVVFSAALMVVVLFYRNGIMGTNEFSWDKLFSLFKRKKRTGGTEE